MTVLRERLRAASVSKEMAWKPWRSPVSELAETVGIVLDKPLNLQSRSQTSTEENLVASVF